MSEKGWLPAKYVAIRKEWLPRFPKIARKICADIVELDMNENETFLIFFLKENSAADEVDGHVNQDGHTQKIRCKAKRAGQIGVHEC